MMKRITWHTWRTNEWAYGDSINTMVDAKNPNMITTYFNASEAEYIGEIESKMYGKLSVIKLGDENFIGVKTLKDDVLRVIQTSKEAHLHPMYNRWLTPVRDE